MEFQIRQPLVRFFRLCTSACTRRVVLSAQVHQRLLAQLSLADNRYETGGLLLGQRWGRSFFVTAVTLSPASPKDSLTEFTLDGEYHLEAFLREAEAFSRPPRLLGIWHSHICDADHFSLQDRDSNAAFARHFHGALSMILHGYRAPNEASCAVWFIRQSGHEIRLPLQIESDRFPIPRCFTGTK